MQIKLDSNPGRARVGEQEVGSLAAVKAGQSLVSDDFTRGQLHNGLEDGVKCLALD